MRCLAQVVQGYKGLVEQKAIEVKLASRLRYRPGQVTTRTSGRDALLLSISSPLPYYPLLFRGQ